MMATSRTPHPPAIVLSFSELKQTVKEFRDRNPDEKIVLTQGTYDLVHIGHARYFQKARSYGDFLIVGVDSDEKVRARKGPDRPVVPEEERLEMLTYLKSVDAVVIKQLKDPKWNLIKTIRPDVLVATRQTYNEKELEQLKEFCKKVVVLDPMATTSTSAKIRRLQIGMAKKIADVLGKKLITTIEKTLEELRQV